MDSCCFSFYVDGCVLSNIADKNPSVCLFIVVIFQSWQVYTACTTDHASCPGEPQAPLTFRTGLLKYLRMNTSDTKKDDNCLYL